MNNIEEKYKTFLRNKVESGTRRKGIHVSDLVSTCLRKPWYRMAGLEIEIDDDSISNFYYGTTIHESFDGMFDVMEYHMFVDPFKNVALDESIEPTNNTVSGSLDAIHNNEIILDFKTTKKMPAKPSEQYVAQINFYSYMYYLHTGIHIKKGGILYIDKSDGFKTRLFEFELEDLEIIRLRMCRAIDTINQDEETPERVTSPLCTVCPFKIVCKPTGYYNYKEKRMIYK